jgi:hypothetical protein
MPALQRDTVFTAYLSGATGPVSVGTALVLNSAGTRYIVSTGDNRTSTGRKTAGVCLTAGDDDEVEVEVQFAGVVPASVTGLGDGSATTVYVDDDGALARGGTAGVDDIIGRCDEDGTAYILGGGVAGAAGGSATPGGSTNEVQINNGGTFGGATNVKAGSGYISIGADPATTGAVRLDYQTYVYSRNSADDGDRRLLGLNTNGTTDEIWLGRLSGAGVHVGGGGSNTDIQISGDDILFRSGDASSFIWSHWDESEFAIKFFGAPWICDATNTKYYKFATSDITVDRTVTLPLLTGDDTFVFESHAQALSNKTYLATSGTVAASGVIRTTSAAQTLVACRNAGDSADNPAMVIDAADSLYIGTTTSFASGQQFGSVGVYSSSSGAVNIGAGNTTAVSVSTAAVRTTVPLAGSSSNSLPFRFKRVAITKNDATDLTLNGAQMECVIVEISGTPGANFTVIAPNSEGAFYIVKNATVDTCTWMKSGGTGTAIGGVSTSWVWHNGTDYTQ